MPASTPARASPARTADSSARRSDPCRRSAHRSCRARYSPWRLPAQPGRPERRRGGSGPTAPGATRHASSAHPQLVAGPPDGRDALAQRAELLAQAHDVRIDGAVEAVVVDTPDALQQELTAVGPRMLGQDA